MLYDVAVIGAGVSGALITRELSRYNLKIALLEKCNDVAMGSTKANSAIVHAGFDAITGTLKAKLNVQGTALMSQVCNELNVPYKNIGSLVVAYSQEQMQTLEVLFERGVANGVQNMRILDREQLKQMEPEISDEATGALWSPTAGIVCPYELTIAATENAVSNGAELIRNCEVTAMAEKDEYIELTTTQGSMQAKYVVNAAGVYADTVAKMLNDTSFKIVSRKGEYYLLDKSECAHLHHVLFCCPGKLGKGILLTPTVDGNVLAGPTALDIDQKDDVSTTAQGLDVLNKNATRAIPNVNLRNCITSFSGIRAHIEGDNSDFCIEQSKACPRLIHAAGIESPGLSAAPAIGRYVCKIVTGLLQPEKKEVFDPVRPAPVRFRELNAEQRKALVEKDKRYGRIVCRCETVTEGEILDAIKGPVGALDVDGIKRRTRSGMGRCQGGFCGSKVVELISREKDAPINSVTKTGGRSYIIYERTK